MRSTECDDGKRRIIAKVVVPMGAAEITMFALSNPSFFSDDDAMNTFEKYNKRELFNIAKESVAVNGANLIDAKHLVNENWSDRQILRAKQHVFRLFPEVD